MLDPELIALIVGAVAATGAAAVTLIARRRTGRPVEPAPGLIVPEATLDPPPGLTPGMIGPIETGEVTPRDLRLTLLDLAARGLLRITALRDDHGHCHDWVLRRTDQPAAAPVRDFERFLLIESFETIGTDNQTSSSTTLSASITRSAGGRAESGLVEELRSRAWLADEDARSHTGWGWLGAVVLLIGLLGTGYMLISWLARGDFRGVIGGLLVVGAGIALASPGRGLGQHTDPTAQGPRLIAGYRRRLSGLRPEDIEPGQAAELFGRLLPWAVALGIENQTARTFETAKRRTNAWGRPIDLTVPWYVLGQDRPPPEPREFTGELAALVNRPDGPGRGRRRTGAR